MFPREAYRPRRTPLAIVGMLVCRTVARLVVLAANSGLPSILSRRRRARYAPGFVVVSVNRLLHRDLGELEELTKYGWSLGLVPTPLWFRHVHGLRRWVGYEREQGEPRLNASTHWFVRIDVDPGLESFAVALLRLDAAAAIWFGRVRGWRSVPSATCASRWPEFVVVSEPGNVAFTADTEALLDARYQASDPSGRARVAVVDTGFDPPPHVNVIVDSEAVAPPVAASIHGAAVCSLISRSCPAVTIELYPVLRADGKVDAGAVFEALQAISAGPPVDIVNLSLSVTGYHYPTQTAILLGQMMTTTREQHETRSTVFVAATGNAGARERMKLPARLDVTLGVGCLEPDGTLWPGSCRGPKDGVLPDAWLVAQGVGLTYGSGGTSYAAASVTGLLAVLVSRGTDPMQAAQRLLIDARTDLPGYAPLSHGAGQARYSSSAAGDLL